MRWHLVEHIRYLLDRYQTNPVDDRKRGTQIKSMAFTQRDPSLGTGRFSVEKTVPRPLPEKGTSIIQSKKLPIITTASDQKISYVPIYVVDEKVERMDSRESRAQARSRTAQLYHCVALKVENGLGLLRSPIDRLRAKGNVAIVCLYEIAPWSGNAH